MCDLRHLPYQEQLHWRSLNEAPKGPISQRAYENHFLNKVSSYATPLEKVLDIVSRWATQSLDWWQTTDAELLHRVNTPITDSKDEWGTAFLELSKVVIEGFQKKPIQAVLRQNNTTFKKLDGTLALLEELISSRVSEAQQPIRLEGLRQAQLIRNKVHSHSGGSEADMLARDVLREYGTYRNHFEKTCEQIADELEMVSVVLQST